MRKSRKTTFSFILIPVVNGLSSLIALPVITSMYGAAGWSAIALGFSLGTGASVVVEMGWGVDGPMRVARASTRSRSMIYAWSFQLRLMVLPVIGGGAACIAYGLAPEDFRTETALMALAYAAVGLSPAWYFTGTREPLKLLVADGLPRLAVTALSSGILYAGLPLMSYPALLLVVNLASPLLGSVVGCVALRGGRRLTMRRRWRLALIQSEALRGRVAGSMYKSLPIALVGLVAPSAVPVFAAAERLQKMAAQFLNAINLLLTSWVGAAVGRDGRLGRADRALLMSTMTGLISGLFFALAAPLVSTFVFSGEATLGYSIAAVSGAVLMLTCVSRGLVIKLVVTRRLKIYGDAAMSGGVTGMIAISAMGHAMGAIGAMLGELLGEIVVVVHQLLGGREPRDRGKGRTL